jgi:hypothetical protein
MTDYRDGLVRRDHSDALERARQCDGKDQLDKAQAHQRLTGLRRQHPKDKDRINAYHCRFCDHWHVGHHRGDPYLRTNKPHDPK